MGNKITFLKVCCWIGAALDGFVAIMMLCPEILGKVYNILINNPSVDFRYAMGLGASLMLGWTILLIWVSRKPLERKGVFLITVIPVLVGLIASEIYAVIKNYIIFSEMITTFIIQLILIVLFVFCYIQASRIKHAG